MPKSKIKKRRLLCGLILLLIAGVAILAWSKYSYIKVGAAYKAKIVCSAIFISGRDESSVLEEDVHADKLSELDLFEVDIDYVNQSVTASFFGLASQTAVFREGIGVTLANGVTPESLREEKRSFPSPEPLSLDRLWPIGEQVNPAGIPGLDAVVASAFDEPDPDVLLRTRAIVVVQKGQIIAEKYAPGFSSKTPLSGWSMTKSVTNALIGILVREVKITRESHNLLSLWRKPADSRSMITLDHLLQMSSGLEFGETYDGIDDVTKMIFSSHDASGFAAAKPLIHPPGSQYKYSSRTTNILCQVIRETIDHDTAYHEFPYQKLLHPIGAYSAIIERDAKGTFVGSSFMYASARDWARIGLLYANDGVWNGEQRILPEGWVDYSRTPASADPDKKHAAHFWLRFDDDSDLPAGTFHMSGHEGQFVTIIPEEHLVVVRLGLTLTSGAWKQEKFVSRVRTALSEQHSLSDSK